MPPHIQLTVNPRMILEDHEYVGIFEYSEENVMKIAQFINMVLIRLNTGYEFNDLTLTRIDLCVNVEFENASLCEGYMRLLRRCNIPNFYHRESYASDDPDYKEKNKRSFRARKNGAAITIYDKNFQLFQEHRLQSNRDIPAALMRIEVSLERTEILSIGRNWLEQVEITNLEYFRLFGTNSKAIMREYIFDFFPNALYLRYDFLCQYLNDINIKAKTRNRMLYLVQKASECSNLNNAVQSMKEEFKLSNQKCSRVLEAFARFGLDPLTLPNSSLLAGLPGLCSILGYEKSNLESLICRNIGENKCGIKPNNM